MRILCFDIAYIGFRKIGFKKLSKYNKEIDQFIITTSEGYEKKVFKIQAIKHLRDLDIELYKSIGLAEAKAYVEWRINKLLKRGKLKKGNPPETNSIHFIQQDNKKWWQIW